MASENIPVIKLNEKSLRRLKEKLEKMHLDEKVKGDFVEKKREDRTPKFEVYKPGVSRLSNRMPPLGLSSPTQDTADNETGMNNRSHNRSLKPPFEEVSAKSSPSSIKRSPHRRPSPSHQNPRNTFKSSDRQLTKPATNRGRGRGRRYQKRSPNSMPSRNTPSHNEDSSNESDNSEEGFLARQNRRRRRRGQRSVSSSQENSEHENSRLDVDDEFIWDDYHGEFLENWPNNKIISSPDDLVVSLNDESKNAENRKNEKVAESDRNQSNHLNKRRSNQDLSNLLKSDVENSPNIEETSTERGILMKKPVKPDKDETESKKKHLYNPDNPDIPILVKPIQRSRKPDINRQRPYQAIKSDEQGFVQNTETFTPANNFHPVYDRVDDTSSLKYHSFASPVSTNYALQSGQYTSSMGLRYSGDYSNHKNVKDSDEMISASADDHPHQHSHEKLFAEAEQLESSINSLMSSKFSLNMFNEKLQILRTKLKQIYKTLLLNYIEIATKHNVEQMLWKTVYHQLMEQLRNRIASSSGEEKNDLKNILIVLLDQAMEFYENLLMRLQQTYKINLKEMISSVAATKLVNKRAGKKTKLAIMSCQRSLVCLGDICRYKENANDTSNFGKARHYYIQARSLEPRNGRPYNQLALLAVHTRRRLDAIYYYTRSLATSGNPILTARESLIALFDDARRKLQHIKKKEQATVASVESPATNPNEKNNSRTLAQLKTIWLLPGQVPESHQSQIANLNEKLPDFDEVQEKSSASMPPAEMLKHFLLIFTHIHGKLFTRVGLDSYETLQTELLDLFHSILESNPLIINKQTLLHLFAINYFTVFDQCLKNKNENGGSTLSMYAVQLTFSMTSVLTRRVTSLLRQLPCVRGQIYDPSTFAELSVFLPSLKISYDWMYSNKEIWYPKPPARSSNTQHDIWGSLAELCDWLIGDYKNFPLRLFTQNHHDLEEVHLPEDFEFSGFAPLINCESEPRYVLISDVTAHSQQSLAADCVRLDLMRDFLEYLCGMEHPLLAFKQGRYIVLVEDPPVVEDAKTRLSVGDEANNNWTETHRSAPASPEVEEIKQDDEDFSQLRALRDSLQLTKEVQDKRKDHIQASLEARTTIDQTIYVKPLNLVPDTNCFIDHLNYIDVLLRTGSFTVFVPLIVLTELQGLALERKSGDEHAHKVHTNAIKAVQFLENKFLKQRDPKLQALTNQGSILHNISFQTQSEIGSKVTNDDLILDCCIKYEEKTNRSYLSTHLTVLLTDDRNLRVKALSRKMPTKSLPEFCKWAGVLEV